MYFEDRQNYPAFSDIMPTLLLHSLKSSFTSRLSRQMGLWVFVGILGLEGVIFLPSAYRRKYEQLEAINMTAKATVNALAIAAPETPAFIDHLPKLRQDAPLMGAMIYNTDGTVVRQFGDVTTFSFEQVQAQKSQLRYSSPWRYEIAIPVILKDGTHYLLLTYNATSVAQDLAAFSIRIFGLILLISISITILTMWIVNSQLIYPILMLQSDMYRSGSAIAQGQPIETFQSQQYKTRNELFEVIQAFYQTHQQIVGAISQRNLSEANLQQTANQLQQTLENLQQTQAQLIHNEKMSSLGQLGAGFAHEINNPINFIDANLQHLQSYGQDLLKLIALYQKEVPAPSVTLQETLEAVELDFIAQDLPSLVKSMQSGAARIRDLVVSFRNFVRLDEADLKAADIQDGLESTLLLLQSRLLATNSRPEIQIRCEYAKLQPIQCYPKQLNQVFMYMIVNAIEAIDKLAQIHPHQQPEIKIITTDTRENVLVQIMDNGIGIESAIQAKVFDPFFTTKDVGQGMGLGLTNSYQIIKDIHHGQLSFDTMPKQGTTFTIELPKLDT